MSHRITRLFSRRVFALVLFVLAALAATGCGPSATPTSAPSNGPFAAANTPAPAATSAPAAAPTRAPAQPTTAAPSATSAPSGGPSAALPIDRLIIKNAQLAMTVNGGIDTAIFRLTGIASDVGGYLVGSRVFVESNNSNRRGAQVTMAVPVDRYEEALNRVRQVAYSIENDTSSSADVTEQYTDLQSRLRNLQSTSDRIREFLGKTQTVEEALKINAQLADVDRQIEEIKGKLNAMTARTTFSTITADIHELVPTATPSPTPTNTATPTATPTRTPIPTATPIVWHPDETFTTASTVQNNLFMSLVRTLGDFTIWFGVVILPYLVVLGVVAIFIRWFVGLFSGTRRAP